MRLTGRIASLPKLPLATAAFLLLGGIAALIAWQSGEPVHTWADRIWFAGLIICGLPVALRTARGMLRGEFAADVVAMLAILGAILLQQPLAGLVVVLMQTGGEALDAYAVARASNAVAALEADAPRIAHRVEGEAIVDIDAAGILPDETLVVRAGELIPCDSIVERGKSHVDTSRLTGEALPVSVVPGSTVASGVLNQEGVLTVRALRTAGESQYARIVELVRNAQASKSPLQRMADRWAVWFTPFTLAACAIAWFVSHDSLRVLAVLVVATPCPLILAAPVAIIGGINRAARRAIIVRSGTALEELTRVRAAIFDKTGTLTIGRPRVKSVVASNGANADELLSLASAVELGSGHLLARVVVEEAQRRGVLRELADDLHESPGSGIYGVVDGHRVAVGSSAFVRNQLPDAEHSIHALEVERDGLHAYIATDSGNVARIDFADELRADVSQLPRVLKVLGIERIELLSGDGEENVARIAKELGLTRFAGDLSPEEKMRRVEEIQSRGEPVLMVGDGTNDAAALAAASVGVALGGHGGGVVAEAADVVLLIDDPSRVAEAIQISRRAIGIAQQSIAVGIGLSAIGMVFAASGHLAPVEGALVQEVIDVAVILNALRAGSSGGGVRS